DKPQNAEGMAKVKRLIKYSVDRWGAYVDFWELLNEQHASDDWYAETIPYLQSIDPYDKLIATSWQRPELDGIDIDAPHWYGNEDELSSDRVTAGRIAEQKRFQKPIIWGEQGNSRGREDRSADGIGGVWDPGSARRMRVRLWTAMFQEAALIFWETSYAKDGHYMNIWIGPEERQYTRALQDFADRLDRDVRIAPVTLEGDAAKSVRAYGLRSSRIAAVYFHHTSCRQCSQTHSTGRAVLHRWDHDRGPVTDLRVTIDVPRECQAFWYDPCDASIRRAGEVQAGRRTLSAPEFSIDLALLLTSEGPPDIDRDGLANDEDPDDDNDGFRDKEDAFPLEREEWADADQDRIGDNLDADVDGDGRADDRNGNGVADNEESDADGDGHPRADAIPWDVFPRDSSEWQDTDGDGIGDNTDTDDDGDGFTDEEEHQAGTNPKLAIDFPQS
ncbi:MAG: hypothetical protein JJ992_18135, partial [Planctomycetes bacterium]|nr:hypothetical protein [Planctomycetota bacterium]